MRRGGRVAAVGVPIGSDAYAPDRAIGIVQVGGVEQFARMLPRLPGK